VFDSQTRALSHGRNFKRRVPREKSSGLWKEALEGDIGTLALSLLSHSVVR
jgi:hypothetical protein